MPEAPRVAIVIVDFNGRSDTLKCLSSLERCSLDGCLTIVVDNGSQPSNAEDLARAHPWAYVVRREDNGGWAGGNNEGIRIALSRGADQVILLNNDTTVAPNLVERLLAAARAGPRFGIIGPLINFMDEPEKVMTDGCVFNRAEPAPGGFFVRRAIPLESRSPPRPIEVDIVNGCCMMVAARVLRRVGLIDERFFLVHEETDLCLRARRAGFLCGVIGESLVLHKGSSSFKRSGKRHQRYYDARNIALLLRKHLGTLRSGRGPWRTRIEYLKYVYYRFSHELEDGHADAALAVVEGLTDALAGRYGPYRAGRRPLAGWLARALTALHARFTAGAAGGVPCASSS